MQRLLCLCFFTLLCRMVETQYVAGDIRFNGVGSNRHSGRVEIYKDGIWGTICSRHFEENEAMVVCRQLGFPESTLNRSQAVKDGRYGPGTGLIHIDDIYCHGYERRLLNCMFSYWTNNCGHSDDMGVICVPSTLDIPIFSWPVLTTTRRTPGPPSQGLSYDYGLCNTQNSHVRLLTPQSMQISGAGVVQIYRNGLWVGISDDCFNRAEAQVACRMLCYPGGKAVPGMEVDFDKSIVQSSTVLSNVTCTGVENNIAQCVYTVTQKITWELATVTCVDMTTQLPTIEPPDLICENQLITANFTSTWPGFIPHSQLTLVWHHNGVCSARKKDNTDFITLSIPFNECGTTNSWNRTHIFYKNAVLYVPAPTGIITRIRTYMIYLTCILPRDYGVGNPIQPVTGSLETIAVTNYTVVMLFYTDNFLIELRPYPIQIVVGDYILVSIKIIEVDVNVKLIVPRCYATPSSDKNHPVRYPLFSDKCKDDETVTFFCLSEREFGFRYQTFKFVHYNEVHIHCEAYVCPKADPSQECDCLCHRNDQGQIGKRKKRNKDRQWLEVKSKMIVMVDPGDDQEPLDYMGPTSPSYPNISTTQSHPTAAATTRHPAGALAASKVVEKHENPTKKVRQTTVYPKVTNPSRMNDQQQTTVDLKVTTPSRINDQQQTTVYPRVTTPSRINDQQQTTVYPKVVTPNRMNDQQQTTLDLKVTTPIRMNDQQQTTVYPKVTNPSRMNDQQQTTVDLKVTTPIRMNDQQQTTVYPKVTNPSRMNDQQQTTVYPKVANPSRINDQQQTTVYPKVTTPSQSNDPQENLSKDRISEDHDTEAVMEQSEENEHVAEVGNDGRVAEKGESATNATFDRLVMGKSFAPNFHISINGLLVNTIVSFLLISLF